MTKLPYTELGAFSFNYRSLGVHGLGISASSNFTVLYEASQLYLRKRAPLCRQDVAEAALRFERLLARGLAVAADDVYPITFGGVLKVCTKPNVKTEDNKVIEGKVDFTRVEHDLRWIADHVMVAFNPRGQRHDVPDLLQNVLDHPERRTFVRRFSELAHKACKAIEQSDIQALAEAVNEYRESFNRWTSENHTKAVEGIAKELTNRLERRILGWKPPGAGASESMILLLRDPDSKELVNEFFEKHKWVTIPAFVTSGLCSELIKSNGEVRFTAGHRIDFIGAADLGQNVEIGLEGCCCSCAIEPRTEIVLAAS